MIEFLDDFDTILIDMNNTFVFGGDRFSLSENYHRTYFELGGDQLSAPQVSRAINSAFTTLDAIYHDEKRYDDFPSVREVLNELPESQHLPDDEKELLVDVFALHETGDLTPEYIDAIVQLSTSHKLHLVSNIWSPRKRFCELLKNKGVAECFASMIFSSDSRSVKPSPALTHALIRVIDIEKCLFVGDCPRCDIQLSKRMGMKSVWVSHGRELPVNATVQPDFVVPSLLHLCQGRDIAIPAHFTIESETLRFRRTQIEDLDYVLEAENDPDNQPYIVNWSVDQHRESFDDLDVEHMIIESRASGQKVGYIILRGLSVEHGPIELKRIVITEKRSGYGFATLALLKTFVFERLARKRLYLQVLPNNLRARRVYYRSGFRYEGNLKDSFKTEDGYSDLHLLAALACDSNDEQRFQVDNNVFRITRNFASRHFRHLSQMYDLQWPDPSRTHEDLEKALLGSDFIVGIIEESTDELVGFCRVVTDRGFRAWIHGVLIREDFRGIGLGSKLMDYVSSSPELSDIHSVSLTCAAERNSFYRKWGFKRVENETVMALKLRT